MGRRGNGEGNFKKLDNGRWRGRIRIGDTRKYVYADTRKEAQAKINEVKRAAEEGRLVVGKAKKTGEYLDEWLEGHVKVTVRPTTYDSYRLNVERVRPFIGGVRLDQLRYEHIQRAYTELLKDLSARSVQQAHPVLRTALGRAVKLGLIGHNPTDRVTAPRPRRTEMRPLIPEEVTLFLEESRPDRLHSLFVLLVTTGLRIGEATALRWDDVDMEAGTLSIRQTVHRVVGKGLTFGEPKTDRSRRRIELAQSTVAALRLQETRQRLTRRLAGKRWTEQGLVFTTENGGPLDASTVRTELHRALERADLPPIRVHDLRHTAATYLLSLGVHPRIVQDLLGHSTITLTMNTYSHVLPTMQKEVAQHMDRLYQDRGTAS